MNNMYKIVKFDEIDDIIMIHLLINKHLMKKKMKLKR